MRKIMVKSVSLARFATGLLVALLLVAFAVAPYSDRAIADGSSATDTSQTLTYANDVAPIIQAHCTSCHHDGAIAPFSLTSYDDVRKRAEVIAAVTQSHYMPPWKASPGYGDFTGVRHLTDAQIATLTTWADQGAAEGDPSAIPPTPTYSGAWSLRQPDVIYKMDQAYPVAADGRDVYRCFVLPTNFPTDKYLSAFEVVPGNHRVVHHVIAYLDTSGKARQLAAASGGYGYTSFGGPGFPAVGALGGWAPGSLPVPLPDGTGILLPKGADIVLQVHYHSDGKPETDQTQIGLYFTDKPVDKRVRILPLAYPNLSIPAGDSDYHIETTFVTPANVTLLQIFPHMHLLGKKMVVDATEPDGTFVPLVKIDDWDFNWQTSYTYQQPIELPKGTRLHLAADYDNSPDNPRNPNNPPKLVTWGEQTTDEMCIAFLFYTVDDEHLTQGIVSPIGGDLRNDPQDAAAYIMQFFDKKQNGKLDLDELTAAVTYLRNRARGNSAVPLADDDPESRIVAQRLIRTFDADGDGTLDADELANMIAVFKGK